MRPAMVSAGLLYRKQFGIILIELYIHDTVADSAVDDINSRNSIAERSFKIFFL